MTSDSASVETTDEQVAHTEIASGLSQTPPPNTHTQDAPAPDESSKPPYPDVSKLPPLDDMSMHDRVVWLPVDEVRPHTLHDHIYEQRPDPEFEAHVLRGLDDGTLEPGVLTPNRLIISGSRRWSVARKHGRRLMPFIIREFKSEPLAIVLANAQRVKTTGERLAEAKVLEEEFAKEAAERQREGARKGGVASGASRSKVDDESKRKDVPDLGHGSDAGAEVKPRPNDATMHIKSNKTSTKVAEAVGLKPETMRKGKRVLESPMAPASLKEDLRNDKVSVDKAYKATRALERGQTPVAGKKPRKRDRGEGPATDAAVAFPPDPTRMADASLRLTKGHLSLGWQEIKRRCQVAERSPKKHGACDRLIEFLESWVAHIVSQ